MRLIKKNPENSQCVFQKLKCVLQNDYFWQFWQNKFVYYSWCAYKFYFRVKKQTKKQIVLSSFSQPHFGHDPMVKF